MSSDSYIINRSIFILLKTKRFLVHLWAMEEDKKTFYYLFIWFRRIVSHQVVCVLFRHLCDISVQCSVFSMQDHYFPDLGHQYKPFPPHQPHVIGMCPGRSMWEHVMRTEQCSCVLSVINWLVKMQWTTWPPVAKNTSGMHFPHLPWAEWSIPPLWNIPNLEMC